MDVVGVDPDRALLMQEAAAHGFFDVRVAEACVPSDAARLEAWVAAGMHGDMAWFAESVQTRVEPWRWLAGVRSVVVLAFAFGQRPPPDPGGLTGRVACYAWGRDYHNLIGVRLKNLRSRLEAAWPGVRIRNSVDSMPVFERAWAKAAGLGWVGKNTCAILPSEGSYYFLATLMMDRPLRPDVPLPDFCGRCRRCLDICPTGALLEAGRLDARRCISYLTIEHDGIIPLELRPLMGRWLFGCDECQAICPHTHYRHALPEDFFPRHAWLPLGALITASDAALLDTFEGSPLRRAAPERLRRNACIVLGNLRDPRGRPALEYALQQGSENLKVHADWALQQLP